MKTSIYVYKVTHELIIVHLFLIHYDKNFSTFVPVYLETSIPIVRKITCISINNLAVLKFSINIECYENNWLVSIWTTPLSILTDGHKKSLEHLIFQISFISKDQWICFLDILFIFIFSMLLYKTFKWVSNAMCSSLC